MAENLLDLLECHICFQIFNNDDRKPKVLPCQHTFCLSCLNKMARTITDPDNRRFLRHKEQPMHQNVKKVIVKCSDCSQEYAAPDGSVTNFINDLTMIKFLDALPQTSPQSNDNDDVSELKKRLSDRLNCLRTKLSDVAEIRAKGISTWEKEVNDARYNIEEMFAEIQSVLDKKKATLLAKLKEFGQTRDNHIHKTMSCAFELQMQEIVEFCSLAEELINRKASQVSESTITENMNRCQDLIEQLDEALANNDKDKKWKVTFQAAYQKDAIKASIENFGNLQLDSPRPLHMDTVMTGQPTGSEPDNPPLDSLTPINREIVSSGQPLYSSEPSAKLSCLPQVARENQEIRELPKSSRKTRNKAKLASQSAEVALRKTEHPWKPRHKHDARNTLTEEEAKLAELTRAFKSILNKLTPQNYQKLMAKTLELPIDNEERLTAIIDLVFEKAIRESAYSQVYANMCRVLSQITVPSAIGTDNVQFRTILIDKCQRAFESEKAENDAMEREIDAMESLGIMCFMGELFKLNMLTENIMLGCISTLLRANDHSLECLAQLLMKVGKDLDQRQKAKNRMDHYFALIAKIIRKRKMPARIKFKLQDVEDLRKCHWVPRRDDNVPKTIAQIHQDAKQEGAAKKIEAQMAIHSHSPKSRKSRRDRPVH